MYYAGIIIPDVKYRKEWIRYETIRANRLSEMEYSKYGQ